MVTLTAGKHIKGAHREMFIEEITVNDIMTGQMTAIVIIIAATVIGITTDAIIKTVRTTATESVHFARQAAD